MNLIIPANEKVFGLVSEPARRRMSAARTALQFSPFRNILFATDLSAGAGRALAYAVELARRSHGMIHAVHVLPPLPPLGSREHWSRDAEDRSDRQGLARNELEKQLQGLHHEILFPEGDACEEIEKLIESKRADLLVMGTHGRTGVAKALLGSVAERLFRQASCPALTVGPDSRATHAAAAEFNCILYATDFSPESFAAARYAISIAKDHRAELVLLHTAEAGTWEDREASLDTLSRVVPLGAGLQSAPRLIVERGAPAATILDTAKHIEADLLVLGARSADQHLTAATHLSHSVASQIVANAQCPVLTVLS